MAIKYWLWAMLLSLNLMMVLVTSQEWQQAECMDSKADLMGKGVDSHLFQCLINAEQVAINFMQHHGCQRGNDQWGAKTQHLPADAGIDYVIDAIDSIKFKAALIYYCKRNKIPVITTGAAGGLTDPTQIMIKDLTRTYNDPLAAKVRR